jgi:hypothetical protein
MHLTSAMNALPLSPRDLVIAGSAGIAIAAACGLRAFLPLLALGLGVHFGWLHVPSGSAWIGTLPVLVALTWATILEVGADKIPALDHALDVIATFLRPAAAAIAAWCTFSGVHPAIAVAAALILGGGALGIHLTKAKVRLGSSALTLGHANPAISFVEDGVTTLLSTIALVAPIAAAAGVVVLVLAFVLKTREAPRTVGDPRR